MSHCQVRLVIVVCKKNFYFGVKVMCMVGIGGPIASSPLEETLIRKVVELAEELYTLQKHRCAESVLL